MKRSSIFILGITTSALLFLCSGCHIYKAYERPQSVTTPGKFRLATPEKDTVIADTALFPIDNLPEKWENQREDTNHLGYLPYQEIFTDPLLQKNIAEALENNFDLQTAFWRVKEYEAKVKQSRLAFTPSLSISPNAGVSSSYSGSFAYSIPAAASWEIDLFGKLLNSKRAALASLLQYESYRQEVQTRLIASVAGAYYTLVMLDQQLLISEATSKIWDSNVETMRALKLSGQTNEAGVSQSLSNSYGVKADIIQLKASIKEQENLLSLLLGKEGQAIERTPSYIVLEQTPDIISAGLPLQLLRCRPDVKQAEAALMVAYANTNIARASFYPQLTLSANGAWTNLIGAIVNPAKLIWSAAAALAMPLFNRGQLMANLRISKAQQEEALLGFQKTILNACNEVSDAFNGLQSTTEMIKYRRGQVEAMLRATEYTQSMLVFGSASYLEVLTAQQNLLKVQLDEITNFYNRMNNLIELYRALGGGAEQESLISLQQKVQEKGKESKKEKGPKKEKQAKKKKENK